jgi:hypothetical protein
MRNFIVTLLLISLATVSHSTLAAEAKLQCDTGPINRTYGNTPWLVYSCNDNQTVIFVSAPGNPTMPFYFSYGKTDGKYNLSGEGTGNQDATAAAAADLKKLSETEINTLIRATKNI